MAHHAVPVPEVEPDPPDTTVDIVDLDALLGLDPASDPLDDDPQSQPSPTAAPYRGPLDADHNGVYPTALRGGVVTDPVVVEEIRRNVERHQAAAVATRRVVWSAFGVGLALVTLVLLAPTWPWAKLAAALGAVLMVGAKVAAILAVQAVQR